MSGSAPEGVPYRSLTGQQAFGSIYQQSIRTHSGGITVRAALNDGNGPLVGIVAGKRVGGAVQRNRAKRRIRAAIRTRTLRNNMSYVITADKRVVTTPYPQLLEHLNRAIDQAHSRFDEQGVDGRNEPAGSPLAQHEEDR